MIFKVGFRIIFKQVKKKKKYISIVITINI